MHIDDQTYQRLGKTYHRILLRTSYRHEGKVKKRTIANLSSCSQEEIAAIRIALDHKHDLSQLQEILNSPVKMHKGPSVGAILVLQAMAKRLGITKALGKSREGKLALWQVMARIIHQGSRLAAVRLASRHATCDVLDLDIFDEDDLYDNLDWLAQKQSDIEDRLFRQRKKENIPQLFLYDVTSSYFEGQQNELADFGYNRDKKKGKKQIVIGLLTDEDGDPLSVQVYRGNTSDNKTFTDQVAKVKKRFGVKSVTMVGDRGMIKSEQIEQLPQFFHYLTAITKPQIKSLLKKGTLQMELFDDDVCEVECEGVRYVVRRNPVRVEEIADQRSEKQRNVQKLVDQQNQKLEANPRTWVSAALRKVKKKIEKLKLDKWLTVEEQNRTLILKVNEEELEEISRLDGCYVIKTDVSAAEVSTQIVHDRYKSLAQVEWAFRTMKTAYLETRPHFVRKENRTRGHVFVVMLAYKIIRYLNGSLEGYPPYGRRRNGGTGHDLFHHPGSGGKMPLPVDS